jgi:hypothetical protein
MRLFHFSDRADIARFVPRPVEIPSKRKSGCEWLNGPLVWAIDEWHQPMYLFPRDCPRILLWPTGKTTEEDRIAWLGTARMGAYIEQDWVDRHRATTLFRYELPVAGFESLEDAGMWVSRSEIAPIAVEEFADLPSRLADAGVELRVVPSLVPLRQAWATSLHVSGIRLRNARDWPTGAVHSDGPRPPDVLREA